MRFSRLWARPGTVSLDTSTRNLVARITLENMRASAQPERAGNYDKNEQRRSQGESGDLSVEKTAPAARLPPCGFVCG